MSGAIVSRACDQCHARKVKRQGSRAPGTPGHCTPRASLDKGKQRAAFSPYRRDSSDALIRAERDWAPAETADELLQWLAGQAGGGSGTVASWLDDLPDLGGVPDAEDATWASNALVLSRPPSRRGSDRGTPIPFPLGAELGLDLGGGFSGFSPAPSTAWYANPFAAPPVPPAPADPCPPAASPLLTLTLDTLVRPQLAAFFARVYPMVPVVSSAHVAALLAGGAPTRAAAALVLSMVALALIHPLEPAELASRPARVAQARMVLDEVCRLRAHWDFGDAPTVEHALTSFLMFGALFEMGLAVGARMRLVEAVAMGRAMRLGDQDAYRGLDPDEAGRRMRMYWVLAVTERAYALQRSGTIAFDGPIARPLPDASDTSLPYLARIFSLVDSSLLLCWQGACGGAGAAGGGGDGGGEGEAGRAACPFLTRARAVAVLRALRGTAADVFGADEAVLGRLDESQKADLLITWQWLRNRIWRLAVAHGLVAGGDDDGTAASGAGPAAPELSVEYAVDVAATTVRICARLSRASMEAHGTGFVEKLYDIASALDVVPAAARGAGHGAENPPRPPRWDGAVRGLYGCVERHRSAGDFAARLRGLVESAGGRLLEVA